MNTWLDQVRDILVSFGATVFWAVIGRLLHHTRMVQLGRRPFFGRALLLELPVALGLGFVADGLAAWLSLTGRPAVALIVSVSYLGPRVISSVFDLLVRPRTEDK